MKNPCPKKIIAEDSFLEIESTIETFSASSNWRNDLLYNEKQKFCHIFDVKLR